MMLNGGGTVIYVYMLLNVLVKQPGIFNSFF